MYVILNFHWKTCVESGELKKNSCASNQLIYLAKNFKTMYFSAQYFTLQKLNNIAIKYFLRLFVVNKSGLTDRIFSIVIGKVLKIY